MREAYRLSKQTYLYEMLNNSEKKIVLFLGYVAKDITPFDLAQKKMLKLLTQLCAEVAK